MKISNVLSHFIKIFDIRYGRANHYQFSLIVFILALSFYCLIEFISFHVYVYNIILAVYVYIFALFLVRRMRDMTDMNSVNLPMLWDLKVWAGHTLLPKKFRQLAWFFADGFPHENRYGLPPKGLNFFTMVTEGYPLPEGEWTKKVKDVYMYKGKVAENANETDEFKGRE